MSYYFSTKIKGNFDDIVQKTTEALKKEGFGVLTDIDVSATLKKKLNEEIEVAAIDPVASMRAIENSELKGIADQIQEKLMKVINKLKL